MSRRHVYAAAQRDRYHPSNVRRPDATHDSGGFLRKGFDLPTDTSTTPKCRLLSGVSHDAA